MIKKLKPSIIRKIWGGNKLEKMKDLGLTSNESLEPIGETLEIFEGHLSYLAKFIDTSDELSIQVHPGDEYARLHENSSGKTECWIILEAAPGAGIYLGLKSHVSKDILKKALNEKLAINELLNFYPVKKGDFFYVPAGSIHAIGKNITLAEVQQNSGITYRVWDWDRLNDKGESRELHVDKSLDVINFDPAFNTMAFFKMKHGLFIIDGKEKVIVSQEKFANNMLYVRALKKDDVYQRDISALSRPCSVLNLDGKIKINQTDVKSYCAVNITDESQLSITAFENGSLLLIF